MTVKRLALRRPDSCCVCEIALPAGEVALWDSTERTVTCLSCVDGSTPVVDVGVAGASAEAKGRRQRERQLKGREQRKELHPILGRLVNALEGPPTSGASWLKGASGEQLLGEVLNDMRDAGILSLHDRRMPRTKANIDHLAVAATGVWVIDAKRYRGLVKAVDRGGWFRSDVRLTVAGRDRTKLVDGVLHQASVVRSALASTPFAEVPIYGALCFIDAEWPLFSKPFAVKGVVVSWGKALWQLVGASGELGSDDVTAVHRHLAGALPSMIKSAT